MAFYSGVVKGVPFEARFEKTEVIRETTGASSEERARGTICRDGAGRVRREFRLQGEGREELELVIIYDYEAGGAVALDVAAKVATRFPDMEPSPGHGVPVTGWAFSGAWSDDSEAGERVIEGVVCRKMRPEAWPLGSAPDPEVVGEIWLSDEIKFSVLERLSEPGREHTWHLYDIRRVEPPDSLFIVPAGYTEVVKSKYGTSPPAA